MEPAGKILAHPLTAIDVVVLRDDVFPLIRRQNNRHACQILGNPHPTKPDAFADFFLLLAGCHVLIFLKERINAVPMFAIHHTIGYDPCWLFGFGCGPIKFPLNNATIVRGFVHLLTTIRCDICW